MNDLDLRRAINDAILKAEPSALRDRVKAALTPTAGDHSHTRRRQKSAYFDRVRTWANSHLQPSFDKEATPLRGVDAFRAFDPDARKGAKPTLFYRALESAGFELDHDGQNVTVLDTELQP